MNRVGTRLAIQMGLSVIALVLLVACSGVPQQDYDAVKQQVAAKEQEAAKLKQDLDAAKAGGQQATTLQQQLQAQVAALQQQLTAKEQEAAKLKQDLDAAKAGGQQAATLQQQLTAKDQEVASIKKDLAAAQDKLKNVVLSVSRNVPPRATATPVPAGFVPPPAATAVPPPPAKFVALAFYVDTLVSGRQESPYAVDSNQPCSMSNFFVRGQRAVWRMEVVDTSTGKVLQTADVTRAVVKLPNGEEKVLRYGRHASPVQDNWYWLTTWDIPLDYPLGVVDFTIEVVTTSGKSGTWKQIQYYDPVRDGGREPRMSVVP